MKSMIKFLLFFLAIVLVITWLVTMYKSGNNEMELTDIQVEQQAVMNGEDEMEEEVLEAMNEVDLEEEYKNILEDTEPTDEELRSENQAQEQTKVVVEKPVTVKKPIKKEVVEITPLQATQTTSNSTSREIAPYMVIVGSFLVPGNADRKKKVVNKLGFDGEVVNFDLSQYHTVLAGRYNTYKEAQSTVNKLKAKGVDAYTKRREK